MDIICP